MSEHYQKSVFMGLTSRLTSLAKRLERSNNTMIKYGQLDLEAVIN